MRILKWFLGIIAALILIFVIVGMFLPREITVARSIEIDAPPADIFPHFNNLSKTVAWSPWLHHDPDAKLTFNEITEGKGAVMEWASDHRNVGSGAMEITSSTADKAIEVALDFGDMGGGTASWDLEPMGNATKATWGMTTDIGGRPNWSVVWSGDEEMDCR